MGVLLQHGIQERCLRISVLPDFIDKPKEGMVLC